MKRCEARNLEVVHNCLTEPLQGMIYSGDGYMNIKPFFSVHAGRSSFIAHGDRHIK